MPIAIIVHGGAWDIPAELHAAHIAGCRAAAEAGWAALAAGAPALDAVEASIRILEDDPVFDAGTGSVLNSEGQVELDAAVMDGRTLAAGAVGAVRGIPHPITLARRVLDASPHVLLVGPGAERFAAQMSIPFCDPASLIVPREQALWEAGRIVPGGPGDTVGAIALDAAGDLAAGNSTGGTMFKLPGRVGDTPLVGCGLYADNTLGAAVCTGHGEAIIKAVLAKSTVDQVGWLRAPGPAATAAIAYFKERLAGDGGVICMAPDGRVGWAHSSQAMACAYRTADMPATVARLGLLR